MENKQSTFGIERIVSLYIEKWYIAVASLLACLLLCTIYVFCFVSEYYVASTTIYVTEAVTAEKQENTELMINRERAKDYKIIVTSNRVLDKVREKTGYTDINTKLISVYEHPDTRILEISVKDSDPYKCTEVVNKITEILIEEVDDIISKNNIKVIDYAKVPQNAEGINWKIYYILAIIAAVGISFMAVLLIEIFDNKVKGPEDCEEKFDIPIIGTIPKYDIYKETERKAEGK